MKDIYLTNFYYYLNQELIAFSGKDCVGDTVETWTDSLCHCSIKYNAYANKGMTRCSRKNPENKPLSLSR